MRSFQVFAAMSPEEAERMLRVLSKEAPAMFRQAVDAAAVVIKARPVFLRQQPFAMRAKTVRRTLPRLPANLLGDELLVVDSHSTDETRALAAARGARVIERDWPGHVAQKEFAVRAARHDWVLCIDADERVSPELRAAVEAARRDGFAGAAGYELS